MRRSRAIASDERIEREGRTQNCGVTRWKRGGKTARWGGGGERLHLRASACDIKMPSPIKWSSTSSDTMMSALRKKMPTHHETRTAIQRGHMPPTHTTHQAWSPAAPQVHVHRCWLCCAHLRQLLIHANPSTCTIPSYQLPCFLVVTW